MLIFQYRLTFLTHSVYDIASPTKHKHLLYMRVYVRVSMIQHVALALSITNGIYDTNTRRRDKA